MALINCPECGKENLSSDITSCPNCNYPLKELNLTDNHHTSKNKKIGIILFIIGCALLIFSFKTITSNTYKFYTENFGSYVASYEENVNISNSYGYGLFRSSYNTIANGYQDLANKAKSYIWISRIKAIVACTIATILFYKGYKTIK